MSTPLPILGRPLDNTALSAYMACPREYWLSMVLHRRGGGGTSDSASLSYGGLIHKILQFHYTGCEPELTETLARGWWAKHGHSLEGEHRTLERGLLDFKRYREKWGKTPDLEQGRTVGFPDSPMVEMAFDIQADSLDWAGKIDRIINLGGLNYIEDHKTTSRLDSNYFRSFELSNQMMGYTWAGQHLAPDLRIAGVRMNVIHILKEKTGFERQLFTFTREQIGEWAANTRQWIDRVKFDLARWPTEQQVIEGAAWPLGHYGDNGCSRKFGLCQYHSLCRVAAPFRHRALAEIAVNPWNPLELDD